MDKGSQGLAAYQNQGRDLLKTYQGLSLAHLRNSDLTVLGCGLDMGTFSKVPRVFGQQPG